MSTTGASSGSGDGSNYNYLSFFAAGSYGRRLEAMRSREPTSVVNIKEEKRRWKWITGIAVAFMCLTNVVAIIALVTLRYQKSTEQPSITGFDGNLYDTIHREMTDNLGHECRPRYRKTTECSQVAAQLFLVANPNRDSVVWTDEKLHSANYNRSTHGAFQCPGTDELEVDKETGIFRIKTPSAAGFYQIHSHVVVQYIPSGAKFRHAIYRYHQSQDTLLVSETQSWNCGTDPPRDKDSACFSSSLLFTQHLNSGDRVKIQLEVNGSKKSPTSYADFDLDLLVLDGVSSYFGILKLGVS